MELIRYQLIRSARKTISIRITPSGQIIVRAPKRMSESAIAQFVDAKRGWIEKHLPKTDDNLHCFSHEEIRNLAKQAQTAIPERVKFYAPIVGVTYGRISIRNQRTRWGSCSAKGNLNFNCLLMLMPQNVVDYVVVHELCHRKHMNHSPAFWAEVKRVLPEYEAAKRWLKENGGQYIARLA